jgi:hypothetical protein
MAALGKRALVAYSDEEDDIKEEVGLEARESGNGAGNFDGNLISVRNTPGNPGGGNTERTNEDSVKPVIKIGLPAVQHGVLKRKIKYSALGLAENPVKFVMDRTFNSKEVEEDDLKFLEPAKQQKQEIKYDTVQGGKSFILDAPREKLWKKQSAGGRAWEPFYEKKMREIYKEKLQSMMNPGELESANLDETDGVNSSEQLKPAVKQINQSEMISFDEQAYIAAKQNQSSSVSSLLNPLATTFLTAEQEQRLGRQAIDLAREESSTANAAKQPWKNRKQYGF